VAIKIKLKNSVVANKAPLPTDLDIGEVAINANAASPAAYIKDSAGAVVKLAGVGSVSTPDATTAAKGVVQLADAAAVTAGTTGRVVDAAQLKAVSDADDWTRTGTEISPKVAGDSVFTAGSVKVGGTTAAPLAKIDGTTGAATAVDVTVTNVKSAMALATNSTGKIIPAAAPFTWDANDDNYIRVPVADRDISVQARMRRCLVTDAGVVTYLDADDSTKLAGDWIRLCETTELATAYTGTHGAEVQNTLLRALAPAWAAGTFTKGALVTNGGFVWECVAATTTATPAAGAAAATLDGTAAQVMVEVPLFSIRHAAPKVGAYRRHELSVALGVVQGGGYVVHPAFVKPDGTYRNFFYVGAYQGTGTNGNGSASGVNNAVSFTRAAARAAMAGRGAGWHQMSYYQYSALAALLFAEYQDFESQRCLGNGAMTGNIYVVPTGLSNARGNRSANAHTPAGANSDYVSYRGVENIYGRAWQWVDGWNINERMCYLTGDPASFADDTAAKYQPAGMVPSGSASFIRDIKGGAIFLADSVAGGSGTTFTGDGLWTSSGWRVAGVGGGANFGAQVGAMWAALAFASSYAGTDVGGRICYAP
jgi:hypothetical protein